MLNSQPDSEVKLPILTSAREWQVINLSISITLHKHSLTPTPLRSGVIFMS